MAQASRAASGRAPAQPVAARAVARQVEHGDGRQVGDEGGREDEVQKIRSGSGKTCWLCWAAYDPP